MATETESLVSANGNEVDFLQHLLQTAGLSGNGKEGDLVQHVFQTAEKGNPRSVLEAMDNYAQNTQWLMNIGNDKGPILDAAVKRFNPMRCLELGTYCGYSAIRIASLLTNPNSKLFSLEINPRHADIARTIIQHAGLSSKIEVVEGKLSEQAENLAKDLKERWGASYFEFVFLDHWKEEYLSDFEVLKEKMLIGKGSAIVADNMKFPGAPDFLSYLRTHGEELETEEIMSNLEYMPSVPDMITISIYKAELPQLNATV